MSLSFAQKMKLAKDLIMNASKISKLVKEKSEELFKYEQKTMFPNNKGHVKINGKGDCLEVRFSPEFSQPDKQRELEKQLELTISISNANMLQYYIEQAKKLGEDIDPEILKQIENQIIDEDKT